MSEPKLISPMLDNFVMGDPISEHNGVRCCPAINKETDEKYIVKIISVPASQTQVDALLLSGAFSEAEAALAYFKTIADGIVEEKNILDELSRLEGYSAVEACQIVPMDDACGFDVYLLSSYRSTLRQHLRRNCMTHLQALNLGLDLCAALSVARRMGYLYVDLKPDNIYINGTQEFRIGDLGFISLNSLQYTSLPDRYRSEYTAPEISDAYSDLNKTIDVYAVGLILYQVFNNGQLPVTNATSGEPMPAPAYADYEMTEIIQKACALNPEDRWQDPVEMGQALVNYMQRNGSYDTPIVPISDTDEAPEVIAEETVEGLYEERLDSESNAILDETVAENEASETDSREIDNIATDDVVSVEPIPEEDIFHEDSDGNLTLIEEPTDETAEEQDASDVEYDEVTNEVTDMLLQADELIAHEAPAPVIQPEPIDVPVPEPIIIEESEETESDDEEESDSDDPETELDEADEDAEDEIESDPEDSDFDDNEPPVTKKKSNIWLIWLLVILSAGALVIAGIFGYKNYYLQTIDDLAITLNDGGTLTVKLTTSAKEKDLTVICTDTYGNTRKAVVIRGTATFNNLTADTAYNLKVTINGFHKLKGKTTHSFATPAETEIIKFEVYTGKVDGSVVLSFELNGPDSEQWNVGYQTQGSQVENQIFSGHKTTIKGLQIGKEYEFTITSLSKINVVGINKVKYVARSVIKAEQPIIEGCYDNKLYVSWTAAEGANAESWNVRCYNDTFDSTTTVTDCSAIIEVPDGTAEYTVEITAKDMSVSSTIRLPEKSTTITDFSVDESKAGSITVNWTTGGTVPEEGIILSYTVDNHGPIHLPVPEGTSATIDKIVPGGTYTFEFTTAKGAPVFKGEYTHTAADAKPFASVDDMGITADDLEFKMCLEPDDEYWRYLDDDEIDFRSEYKANEKVSFIVKVNSGYEPVNKDLEAKFIIRNSAGDVIDISSTTEDWYEMIYKGLFKLELPSVPTEPGTYTVAVYLNNGIAHTTEITIVE